MTTVRDYLRAQPGRCPVCGFHVATQGHRSTCAPVAPEPTGAITAEEWAVFTSALRTAAVDGLISQTDMRPLIRGRIFHKHIGLAYRRAKESGLIERRLDIGVLRPPVRLDGIAHRPLDNEALVAVVPERHRLAGADTVRIDELRHEDFIMYAATLGSVVNDAVVRACLASGFYPHRAYEVTETSAALALVAAGLGIAVLPDSIRAAPREGVLCKDIEDALSIPLALAWREDDESPLLHSLLTVLEQNDLFLEGPA